MVAPFAGGVVKTGSLVTLILHMHVFSCIRHSPPPQLLSTLGYRPSTQYALKKLGVSRVTSYDVHSYGCTIATCPSLAILTRTVQGLLVQYAPKSGHCSDAATEL